MWSPDGARLSFAQVEDDTCLIRIIPASGGVAQTVAACETGLIDAADWSPDGNTLYTSLSYTQQPGSRGIAAIDAFAPRHGVPHTDGTVVVTADQAFAVRREEEACGFAGDLRIGQRQQFEGAAGEDEAI